MMMSEQKCPCDLMALQVTSLVSCERGRRGRGVCVDCWTVLSLKGLVFDSKDSIRRRSRMSGAVSSNDVPENIILKSYRGGPLGSHKAILNRKTKNTST